MHFWILYTNPFLKSTSPNHSNLISISDFLRHSKNKTQTSIIDSLLPIPSYYFYIHARAFPDVQTHIYVYPCVINYAWHWGRSVSEPCILYALLKCMGAQGKGGEGIWYVAKFSGVSHLSILVSVAESRSGDIYFFFLFALFHSLLIGIRA